MRRTANRNERRLTLFIRGAILAAVALLGVSLSAQGAGGAWRAPDGSLYFGSAPPAGSVPVDDVRAPAPAAMSAAPLRAEPAPKNEPAPTVRRVAPPAAASAVSPAGSDRELTTCVRNDSPQSERAWIVSDEHRYPLGVIHPGQVGCLSIDIHRAGGANGHFRLETEPVASR